MGVISIVIGIINQLITGGAPPCGEYLRNDRMKISNTMLDPEKKSQMRSLE